jgi:hypothetical protein
MSEQTDAYRRKADALLKEATDAENLVERGRLIDEAIRWHRLAVDTHDDWLVGPQDEDEMGAA